MSKREKEKTGRIGIAAGISEKNMIKSFLVAMLLIISEDNMGAWGYGVFENDAAVDLVSDILDANEPNQMVGDFVEYCHENLYYFDVNPKGKRFIDECVALSGVFAAIKDNSIRKQLIDSISIDDTKKLTLILNQIKYDEYIGLVQLILDKAIEYIAIPRFSESDIMDIQKEVLILKAKLNH